jgi:hypothetical protein
MAFADLKVTTQVLWQGALIFAVIDILIVAVLARHIKVEKFRDLKWRLVITTGVFWFLLLLTLMSWLFWEPVYHYVFPAWARWFIPPVYGVLFAATGYFFWWLARRLPGNPIINWCVLGGLWGIVTHTWAIYRGILDKVPMLQGASPVATAIMPIFEFAFYYCVILSIAALYQHRKRKPV